MSTYNIIQKFPNHEVLYFDFITGGVFEGTKLEAQKIVFMLGDLSDGVFEIREAKQ